MKKKLENRIALITGASQGIGRVIAFRFAEEGADLFIGARNEGPLEEVAKELRGKGVRVVFYAADVSDQEAVRAMVEYGLQELGQIDILVNNAGAFKASRFVEYSLEDFDRVMKVNLYGVFHVTQAVLPGMMKLKKGKVINIASTAGKWGSRNQSAYNASKHAVVGLTRSIGLEMAPYKINVNAICPSLVDTYKAKSFFEEHSRILGIPEEDFFQKIMAQIPMKQFIKPEEIAELAIYLASDESDSITCQSFLLCGGHVMV